MHGHGGFAVNHVKTFGCILQPGRLQDFLEIQLALSYE